MKEIFVFSTKFSNVSWGLRYRFRKLSFLNFLFHKSTQSIAISIFLINSFKNSQTGNGCNILIWLSVLTNQNNPNEEIQIRHLDAIVFPLYWILSVSIITTLSLHPKCQNVSENLGSEYLGWPLWGLHCNWTSIVLPTTILMRVPPPPTPPRRLWGGRWTPPPGRRRSDCQEQQYRIGSLRAMAKSAARLNFYFFFSKCVQESSS